MATFSEGNGVVEKMCVELLKRSYHHPQSVRETSEGSMVWILPSVPPCLPWTAAGTTYMRSVDVAMPALLELAAAASFRCPVAAVVTPVSRVSVAEFGWSDRASGA